MHIDIFDISLISVRISKKRSIIITQLTLILGFTFYNKCVSSLDFKGLQYQLVYLAKSQNVEIYARFNDIAGAPSLV